MIVKVCEENLPSAAEIHSRSWKESHASFCSEEFLKLHSATHQEAYLRQEIRDGKQLYMMIREIPVGIVSVRDSLIENLYILPEQQNKGCGTELLLFAIAQCRENPRLWILDNNVRAQALYERHGFRLTGNKSPITEQLYELEMELRLPVQAATAAIAF